MTEPKQTLSKVSNEVEESETKLNLVNLCIKAQQDLAYKLRKETKRRKELCNFVRNNNLQLVSEIKNAEQEIKSMLAAHESIKSANVELKKELLLYKENNIQNLERMKNGEIKYEELWLQSKKRYERIPYVQKWLQATRRTETLKANGTILENEAKTIYKDIKTKKEVLLELDRKQIVKLAEFLNHEMPSILRIMKEKSDEIKKLTESLDAITKEQKMRNKKLPLVSLPATIADVSLAPDNGNTKKVDDIWPNLSKYIDDTLVMPRLQLANTQQDVLNVKLKLDNAVMIETTAVKRSNSVTEFEKSASKRLHIEDQLNSEFISSYLNKPISQECANDLKDKAKSYSMRKLIHILEDVKLDDNETYGMVAKVNPVKLQEVNMISGNDFVETSKTRTCTHSESEEMEDTDLVKSNSQNILNPPTQFIDLSQGIIRSSEQEVEVTVHLSMEDVLSKKSDLPQLKSSQENAKKRVSFHLPMIVEEVITKNDDTSEVNIDNKTTEPEEKINLVTDGDYMTMKSMILKKHNIDNLDLSPPFVYAKQKSLQTMNESDEVVTSKFFNETKQIAPVTDASPTVKPDHQTQSKIIEIDENSMDQSITHTEESTPITMEDKAVTSSKSYEPENLVGGLLFNHGPGGLPESLDVSMSTTGFEDVDGDYPHCLDNSLLLSPKENLQPMSVIAEQGSQELPNFLSGFRKTGLFFFGQNRQAEANQDPESNAQNEVQKFKFNFDDQENKPKGGLFSFFR